MVAIRFFFNWEGKQGGAMVLGKLPVPGRPTNVNNQLLQLCTALTAWSDSDHAVLAVQSCNSW